MEDNAPVQKKCYYETMGIDINATDDQIKRSFKKLSLKYHPDKNRKDPEAAKKAFQEITEAYNCISDPKERQWYDNNREKLLMNKKDMSKEDLELQSYGFDIFAYFESEAFEGFGDAEGEFFQVYNKAFSTIDYEEQRTYKFQTKLDDYKTLPEFGNSTTAIEQVVKFYEEWSNFTTVKNFAWADEHDTREGENRWEKRSMESDNEKLRRKEKKKYIQTIKDLVTLVKKKDPRREQLIELEKKEQERIIAARENNKSDKQKKKEQQERERLEKLKKKEEEQHKAWLVAEEKRLQLIEEQQKQALEKQTAKVSQPKQSEKKPKENTEFDQKLYDELEQLSKSGGTLTKKQQKELKKLQAQKKAEADKIKQQKKKQEKKAKKTEEEQQQQEEQEEEATEQNGDAKKRKRNKKKKNAQTEEKPVEEEKKEWKPWVASEEDQQEETKESVGEVQQQQVQEEEDDGWGEATGSKKAKQKIQKEMKKIQKSQNNQDKRCDETKNIEDNFFASVDDVNLKKHDRHQKSHLNQKQRQQQQADEQL